VSKFRIESLLSARLFLTPQVVGNRLYFVSNLSGRLSLYTMDLDGSVPEPLLPPDIALPNPDFVGSNNYRVLPSLGKILIMLDKDGDENYQPVMIPVDGGIPEPLFGERFAGQQLQCSECDPETNLALFTLDPRTSPVFQTFRADLSTLETTLLGESMYGNFPVTQDDAMQTIVLADGYTAGDTVLFFWQDGQGERRLLFGKPLEQRSEDEEVPLNGIGSGSLTPGSGFLFTSSLFDDCFGLTYFSLQNPEDVYNVPVNGLVHQGTGEMVDLKHRQDDRYTLTYNIDGSSWVYEGIFDEKARQFNIRRVLVGEGQLSNGVLESLDYEKASGRYALSFSTATSPSQIYVIELEGKVLRKTNERVLGIPPGYLSAGEDYPYTSHDGLRVSARLYLPAAELGYTDKRPVVFYVHGGPQSQERPDFTWFSMPLIQFLTLNGFAVWVPNVRGSSGYGMAYMKRVDRDWGGQDRLDHVAAFELLKKDPRLDMNRVGVMGRSYGGYMTLTLAGRHPELWKAAVDMFGPYSLFTFLERIPETWKTYFYMALGDPVKDKDFLTDRSPSTHLPNLACPMLVIQGANDPRVIERESRDVVEQLRAQGKQVEYIVYSDEGHDVIKFPNKVDCYNRIVDFFTEQLNSA
jgi:pimeloyl-ACP methyl ester carboxylesterase